MHERVRRNRPQRLALCIGTDRTRMFITVAPLSSAPDHPPRHAEHEADEQYHTPDHPCHAQNGPEQCLDETADRDRQADHRTGYAGEVTGRR